MSYLQKWREKRWFILASVLLSSHPSPLAIRSMLTSVNRPSAKSRYFIIPPSPCPFAPNLHPEEEFQANDLSLLFQKRLLPSTLAHFFSPNVPFTKISTDPGPWKGQKGVLASDNRGERWKPDNLHGTQGYYNLSRCSPLSLFAKSLCFLNN